ncbi:MAG TPA: carboxypeptidase regulatory-like domain-containing protein [Pyrinomonadaceae bacterium]|nr:carboxypeptidase regulatory-like domain-containing protein [Pyrinomonadaceae bacterium]
MKIARLLIASTVLLTWLSVVTAQTGTSNINGRVVDAKEALLAGATVTLTNEATHLTQTQTTSDSGLYAFNALPPGRYTITVEAQGFKTYNSSGNVLTVGSPLVVNVTMEVGQATERVDVVASYERIETTSAMLGGIVDRQAITELPLNGRNPLNLIVLEPGLVQRTTGAAGSGTHVFGSRDRAHNVTIDGIDANESSVPNPQSNIFRLTPDNVQEYRVVTHNATPEFGRNSGANVAVATRSGTNEFHGDIFYFHRNTALNANEWFNNASGIERPILLLHQFGGDGGGPIIKDKTFFFASYQANRIKQSQPIGSNFGVPRTYTSALRSGVFRFVRGTINVPGVTGGISSNSPLLVDSAGNLKPGVQLCGGAITTNCIASYNIFTSDPLSIGADPTVAKMVSTFPTPNVFNVGDGLNTGGFAWNPPSRFRGPFYMFRVDHKINDSNDIFGRFLWSDYDTFEGDFLNGRPAIFPGFPPLGEVFRRSQSLAINYRRVFSPKIVNEFTAGYSRFRFLFSLRESQEGIDPPPFGQECFGDDSFSLIDTPFCNTLHTERQVTSLQFIDNLSYLRGAHNFRVGFNIRLYRHDDERGVPGGFNGSPTIVFSRTARSPLNETQPWVLPSGMSSTDRNNLQQAIVELAGIPGLATQAFQARLDTDAYGKDLFTLESKITQMNFYFQDEWRFSQNLTFNYGVRWEINSPPTDADARVFVPDRAVDGSQGPVTYVRARSWWQRYNNNAFAPRVGIAWTPWTNTVIRAGYGIAFDTLSTFQVTSVGGKVPGSVQQCRVNVQDSAQVAQQTGCMDLPNNVRLTQLLAAVNPFALALPTKKPSELLRPENATLAVAPNVGAFDPNLQIPTVHEWSLTVQRELPWNFVGQVGYIGKRGTHLYRAYDLNQLRTDQPGFLQSFLIARDNVRKSCRPDGTGCPAGVTGQTPTLLVQLTGSTIGNPNSTLNGFTSDFQLNALGTVASRIDRTNIVNRGFPANYFRSNPQFSEIFYFDAGGDSYYHGAIVQVRRRLEKGLDFGLSYTFSKSIDNMSVDPVAATSGGGLGNNSRTPTDVRNFALDRSVSDFDNAHVLVINTRYELPFGKGRRFFSNIPGAVNQLLGDWSLTGIYTYQSGEPYTINSGAATANFTIGGKQTRADLRGPLPQSHLQFLPGVTGPVVFNVTDRDSTTNCRQVIDTESFFCIPEPGGFGMGRNTIRGPGFWNFDFGILKRFNITERVNIQFRAEMFNAFNHPNFENPRNATEGSPTVTSSLFGQTCCVTSSVPASSTIIATGEPNRVIQFALKVQF